MALTNGTKLGPYTIEASAGAGGMGEVYRAKDTRLDRTVAIKVLPHSVADNPDLKARFEREAKTISSLNHPNICTLHDIGHQDGIDYLVMEYIEGKTLSERLEEGPLPNQELFRISIQIADALDKAHRQGLVHRDLKPGNIMLTREGAKLLDFGLAKLQIDNGAVDVSQVTRTTPLTGEGTIVGTLQYMSPEQLEGEEADGRSDIFAFGCVLYEMATGRPAFSGSGRASLIASIMKELPQPISQIQPLSPPMLERAVMQCLEKEPEHRWQSAGDLKRSLQWISEGGSQAGIPKPVTQRRRNRERLLWTSVTILTIATLGLSALYLTRPTPEKPLVLSDIVVPTQASLADLGGGSLALSPDGSRLAFTAIDSVDSKVKLWVRPINSLVAQPLPGTDNAFFPFWSPDSRYIAFYDGKSLKKILATGGPTLTLAPATTGRGGDWNDDGVIIFSPDQDSALFRVSAAGGNSEPLTTLDTTIGESCHRWAKFLPDGNHYLFFSRVGENGSEQDAICVSALDSKEIKRIIPCKSTIGYADGSILFVRSGTIMAQRFDESSLEIIADPVPIIEDVVYLENWSRGVFSVAQNGSLAFRQGTVSTGSQLRVYDTLGRAIDSIGTPVPQFSQELSPDEQYLLIDIFDRAAGHGDIWLWDLNRRIKTRLSFGAGADYNPLWAPDGESISWTTERDGQRGIVTKSTVTVDSAHWLMPMKDGHWQYDRSRDGRYLVITSEAPVTKGDIAVIDLQDSLKSHVIVAAPGDDYDAVISPDGRWMAYVSDETGRDEVYVTTFPTATGKWQVSTNGGTYPRWRGDGAILFYLDPRDQMMKAAVNGSGSNFIIGMVEPMFAIRGSRPGTIYDVTSDGSRFYVNELLDNSNESRIVLVQNWTRLLDAVK